MDRAQTPGERLVAAHCGSRPGKRPAIDLAEQGYHVVVPDMRGYDEGDAPQDIASYRLDVLVADVLALADSFGGGRFRLVGHDWGAIVAWAVGASHPERLERLAVMDGPHPDFWATQAMKTPDPGHRRGICPRAGRADEGTSRCGAHAPMTWVGAFGVRFQE